tara:strand:- start:27 stop:269 length:243 start_codon:yes stop_codon:yes gene_type:complete
MGGLNMYKVLLLMMSLSFVYTQTYCAGDQVSISDQNQVHVVGAGIEGEYEVGDTFKLADWNGELNGGQYHVVFIDMSASW